MYPKSWQGLINLLEDAELGEVAEELKRALAEQGERKLYSTKLGPYFCCILFTQKSCEPMHAGVFRKAAAHSTGIFTVFRDINSQLYWILLAFSFCSTYCKLSYGLIIRLHGNVWRK